MTKSLTFNHGRAKVELVPDRLSVSIHLHELPTQEGNRDCWTYVTDGLQAFRQPEVCMTLLRRHDAQPLEEPLHFFSMLYQLAVQGRIVTAGGYTQFGERKLFNRHLAYMPAQPIASVPLPDHALMAISITDEELEALKLYGALRVMARLGQQARYFPFPPWLDPSRPGLSFSQTDQHSVLRSTLRIQSHNARILKTDDSFVLRLTPSSRSVLAPELARLDEEQPVAFLTGLDAGADGLLVWEPGQTAPVAIAPPDSLGEQLCGCFVAWVPGQESDRGQLFEDGVAMLLTTSRWRIIRQAIVDQQPLEVRSTDNDLGLRIEWDR